MIFLQLIFLDFAAISAAQKHFRTMVENKFCDGSEDQIVMMQNSRVCVDLVWP